MIQEAWKVAFPSLRFPLELIGMFPPLVAVQQEASRQPTNEASKLKVSINKNLESRKILACSVNPTEGKKDKKLDYSHCWMKATKEHQSTERPINSGQV